MPLQNRVTPLGDIISSPARGHMMGNRGGPLHRPDKTLAARRWVNRHWICCSLDFKDRRREVMAPGRYTELFFLDEATALAAGHRPCFECRREAALRFVLAFGAARGLEIRPRATDIDHVLHAERLDANGAKRIHTTRLDRLPDGAFVLTAAGPALVCGRYLLGWTPTGYVGRDVVRPDRTVALLTPPSIIGAMNHGYRPKLHDTALDPE